MPTSALQTPPIHLDYDRFADPRHTVPECTTESGPHSLGPEIGRGAMGVVYQARHRELGRTVAMKIMRGAGFSNSDEVGRFRAETEASAKLDHPNIVPVYEVGEIFGQPFFTMKLIEGGSLNERLNQGRIEMRDAVRLVAKIASAVQHAHERGVLHRDIKPGNILLTPPSADEDVGEPYLTDFGLAKFAGVDTALTCPGDLIGTPDYISPEQARGSRDLTTSCDVWALGVLLYQLLSGELPFNAPTPLAILDRVKNEEPLLPDCDRDLSTIIMRCLEKEPAQRMPTAGFLADELNRWLDGEPIRSRHIGAPERIVKWMRRNPWRVAVAAVLMLTIFAGVVTSHVLWRKAQDANFSLNAANDTLTHRNEELAQSLRYSTATRLASESRLQTNDNAQLGLLLAVESAETTRPDRMLLPESVNALYHALQHAGGGDTSAPEKRRESPHNCGLFPSPDGRWLLTTAEFSKKHHGALFDCNLPPGTAPVCRWELAEANDKVGHVRFCWFPDSRRIVAAACVGARVWQVGDIIDGKSEAAPRIERSIDYTMPTGYGLPDMRIVNGADGGPAGILYCADQAKNRYGIFQRFDFEASTQPDATIFKVEGGADTLIRRMAGSKDGRHAALFDPYRPGPPALVRFTADQTPTARFLRSVDETTMCSTFSESGRYLAAGGIAGAVALYDLNAGDFDLIEQSRRIVCKRSATVDDIAISPDDKWLIAVGGNAMAHVISLEGEPRVQREIRIPSRALWACAFSPDSRWYAIGGDDNVVRVWPTGALESVRPIEFRGLPDNVASIRFSADMRSLHARTAVGACRRWVFNGNHAGALPLTSVASPARINSLAVSPDGRWVATAGSNAQYNDPNEPCLPVRFFNVSGGLREFGVPGHRTVTGVAFSPDGKWFGSTGRDALVKVWPMAELTAALESGGPLPTPRILKPDTETRDNTERRLAFHPRGSVYATSGDGLLFEWDLNSSDDMSRHWHIHSIMYILSDVKISPDGNWLVVGRHGNDHKPKEGWTQYGNMALVFDCSKPGELTPHLELPAKFAHNGVLTFSADGRWMAGNSREKKPGMVWDLQADEVVASPLTTPPGIVGVTGIAFPTSTKASPNEWLAFGTSDNALVLWDWKHGPNAIRRIETNDTIHSACYLPDGRLATGSADGRLRIWETDPAKLIQIARQTAGRELTEGERTRFRRQ